MCVKTEMFVNTIVDNNFKVDELSESSTVENCYLELGKVIKY